MSRNNYKYWESFSSVNSNYLRKNKKCFNELCDEIDKILDPGMLVLEITCGNGMITKKLSDNVLEWTATDPSHKLLQIARKAYRKGRGKGTNFRIENPASISYETGTFDAVLITNSLQIHPEPEKVLKEVYRVLRSGGVIIAPTIVFEREYSFMERLKLSFAGFKSRNKWSSDELADLIESKGFNVTVQHLIKAQPLDECLIVATKKTARDNIKNTGMNVLNTIKSFTTRY